MKMTKQSKLHLEETPMDEELVKITLDEDWGQYTNRRVKCGHYSGIIRKLDSLHVMEATKKIPPLHDFPYKPPKRECPRRLLCSPYKGCLHQCKYCYAIHNPRYGVGTKNIVFTNYVEAVQRQIKRMPIVFPLYMSQDTDPFQQPIERHYRIIKRLTEYLVEKHLPFVYITKDYSAVDVLDITNGYDLYFVQFTITTLDEDIRKIFEPYSSPINARFKALEQFSETGCYTVVRIDPILPYITDDKNQLHELVSKAKEHGANHIITSICDIGHGVWQRGLKNAVHKYGGKELAKMWQKLYWNRGSLIYGNWAEEKYRINILRGIRELAVKNGISFAACQENVNRSTTGNVVRKHVLNYNFMTSPICEGYPLPSVRQKRVQTEKFEPIKDCTSDCLVCRATPPCGFLHMRTFGRSLKNIKKHGN